MTSPSISVPGATIAVTRRTTMRKAFLAPYHPMVEALWRYAIADAQAHTGVAVHSGLLVINHEHLSATSPSDNMSEFLRRVHVDLSKGIHCLLCELRYDAPREVFDDRPAHKMRLLDAEAQAAHYIYEQVNGVAAGLVSRPEHMPQRALNARLWRAGGECVERPPLYFSRRRRPAVRDLAVTPPPELYYAFGGDLDALVHHLDKTTEFARARLIAARNGRAPVGAKALRRIHPWDEPRTLRDRGGQRVPTYKVGARGLVGVQHEIAAAADTTRFRHEHRCARVARRDGDEDAVYPYGTTKAVSIDGAPMRARPHSDAVVTRPGRTLAEVQEVLAEERRSRRQCGPPRGADGTRSRRHALIAEVRGAFEDEATALLEQESIELANEMRSHRSRGEPRSSELISDEVGLDGPRGVEVRHRLDSRRTQGSSAARVVVRRDSRRGRPPKRRRVDRHGGDPPA